MKKISLIISILAIIALAGLAITIMKPSRYLSAQLPQQNYILNKQIMSGFSIWYSWTIKNGEFDVYATWTPEANKSGVFSLQHFTGNITIDMSSAPGDCQKDGYNWKKVATVAIPKSSFAYVDKKSGSAVDKFMFLKKGEVCEAIVQNPKAKALALLDYNGDRVIDLSEGTTTVQTVIDQINSMTSGKTGPDLKYDVDSNGSVNAMDVLVLINLKNEHSTLISGMDRNNPRNNSLSPAELAFSILQFRKTAPGGEGESAAATLSRTYYKDLVDKMITALSLNKDTTKAQLAKNLADIVAKYSSTMNLKYDVDGSGNVSPNDILQMINFVNELSGYLQ